MTIKLRPHHLLCMLTYVGKGYTSEFVEHYNQIINRLASEPIQLVTGPDDICQPLLSTQDPHCFNSSVNDRDQQALAEVSTCLGLPLAIGTTYSLTSEHLATLRTNFAQHTIRHACTGCEWSTLCDDVAKQSFKEAKLQHLMLVAK